MRTLLKAILIIATIAGVGGATFYFAETRLGPPRAVEMGNAHLEHLQWRIAQVVPALDIDSLNRLFFQIHHEIAFLDDDSLLDRSDSDRMKGELANRYGPLLADWCMERFHDDVWEGKLLKEMRQRVDMLKGMEKGDGTAVVDADGALTERLDSIRSVVRRHDHALALAKRRIVFESMQKDEELLEAIAAYRRHDLLKNDVALCDSLRLLPRKMEQAHYDYLCERVDHMKQYKWMKSMENVEKQYEKYNRQLEEYDERAYRSYGTFHSVTALRRQLNDHLHAAREYWEEEHRPYTSPTTTPGSGFHFEVVREGY